MATSVISYNDIGGNFRLDGLFYKREYLEIVAHLKKNPDTKTLVRLGKAYKSNYNPSKKPTEFFQYLDIANVDITDGTIETQRVIGYESPSRARRKVKEGSIVISTVRPNRNAVTIIDKENKEIIVSTGFYVFNTDSIDPYYLFIYLKTQFAIKQLMKQISNAMYPTILPEDISNLLIYTPNPKKQESIRKEVIKAFELKKEAKKLLNEALEKTEKAIKMESLKTSSVQVIGNKDFLASGRLDSTYYKQEYLELLSKLSNHDNRKLRQICTVKNGFAFASDYFDLGSYPLIKIAQIKITEINKAMCQTIPEEYFKNTGFKNPKENCLLVGMDGTDEFRAAIITDRLVESAINQRIAILSIIDKSIDPYYLLLILNSKIGQYQLVREKSLASTVGHISNDIIRDLIIPIFDNNVMRDISNMARRSYKLNYEAQTIIEILVKTLEEEIQSYKS